MKYLIKINKIIFSTTLLIPLYIFAACVEEETTPPPVEEVSSKVGCTDAYASNYDDSAGYSDNSCTYTGVACDDCDYILQLSETTLDNDELGLAPGSKIGILAGERQGFRIFNFFADTENGEPPFIFTNCGGQVIMSGPTQEVISIQNTSGIRITGTGSSDEFGFVIAVGHTGLRAYKKTNHIEIDHIEVGNIGSSAVGGGVGIWVVTRPNCDGSIQRSNYSVDGVSIHHNYVHDTYSEGMYVGGSFWNTNPYPGCEGTSVLQPEMSNIQIHNNVVENIGLDGIQVGSASGGAKIYKNVVRNYGIREVGPHQAGFMINPGTTGKVFSNLVDGGTGVAIYLTGFDMLVHSNLILNCGLNAFHIGDRKPLPNSSYRILNNTMINVGGQALHNNSSESVDNVFNNNFMANITNEEFTIVNRNEIDLKNNIMTASLDDYAFENPEEYDYTPSLGNVMIDSGLVFDRDKLIVDFFMREREKGASPDIGSHENQTVEE